VLANTYSQYCGEKTIVENRRWLWFRNQLEYYYTYKKASTVQFHILLWSDNIMLMKNLILLFIHKWKYVFQFTCFFYIPIVFNLFQIVSDLHRLLFAIVRLVWVYMYISFTIAPRRRSNRIYWTMIIIYHFERKGRRKMSKSRVKDV